MNQANMPSKPMYGTLDSVSECRKLTRKLGRRIGETSSALPATMMAATSVPPMKMLMRADTASKAILAAHARDLLPQARSQRVAGLLKFVIARRLYLRS